MKITIAYIYLLLVLLSAAVVDRITKNNNIGEVIDCKILRSDSGIRAIECKDNLIIKVLIKDWPKEWEDTKEVGNIVKFQVVEEGYMIPFKSCVARAKDRLKEYESRGMNQMQKPTNLPVDKDCQ